VVEGVALDEDGDVGERVVAFGEVVEIGVGFAAEVGKRGGVGEGGTTFVIDGDSEGAWHPAEPGEVFGVAGHDEFKRRRHGGR
jgi:uncharacterized protein YaiE (UPF0345 family)